MAFVVEHLTEQDRLRYNTDPDMLDLSKIPLKRWITDQERGISIWGGMASTHWMAMAEGDYRWAFNFRFHKKLFKFVIFPSEGSKKLVEDPYIISWGSVDGIFPNGLHGYSLEDLMDAFKDALVAYSILTNKKYVKGQIIVEFGF